MPRQPLAQLQEYREPNSRPADFDAFWDCSLKERDAKPSFHAETAEWLSLTGLAHAMWSASERT
jgi:cephalosporin-C deacetylase-like acetyl esterase